MMQPLSPFLRFSLYCPHCKEHPSILVRESICCVSCPNAHAVSYRSNQWVSKGLISLIWAFPFLGLPTGRNSEDFDFGDILYWPQSVYVVLQFLTGPLLVVEITRLKYRKNASDSMPSLNPMSQSFLFNVPLIISLIATNILLSE